MNHRNTDFRLLLLLAAVLANSPTAASQVTLRRGHHECAPVSAKDKNFLDAVKEGKASRVRQLIRQGADANTKDDCNVSALTFAVAASNVAVMKELIAANADVNAIDGFYNQQPLFWALADISEDSRKASEVIAVLLNAGADPNVKKRYGGIPLTIAVQSDAEDVAKVLIEKGANIHVRDGDGRTAYSYAAQNGNFTLKRLLLSLGADPRVGVEEYEKEYGNNAFFQAAADGRTDVVDAMLESGTDVNSTNEAGVTALMRARDESTFDALMRGGADVSKRDKAGATALIWASLYGRVELVKRLIAAGANASIATNNGKTALDLARGEVQSILINAGARHGK
jgi:ankyrin repeat protein